MHLSVVICTRNRAARLATCLERVTRLAGSTPWELVVVDNGSTDGTADVLHRFEAAARVRPSIVREPQPGLGRARNRGWRAARGELIAFTDDDCYPAADYLDQMAACFDDPSVGFVGGRILLFDPSDLGITIQELDHPVPIPAGAFIPAGLIQGANFAFRRAALEAISGFDDDFGAGTPFACEDVDALARASALGWRGAYDPRPVVHHHHGRKTAAEGRRLMRTYDVARGAYYLKCALNPLLRGRYVRSWARLVAQQSPRRTVRELRGAVGYLRARTGGRRGVGEERRCGAG